MKEIFSCTPAHKLLAAAALMLAAVPSAPVRRPNAPRFASDENWSQEVAASIRASEWNYAPMADGALVAPNRAQGLWSRFDRDGARFTPRKSGGWDLRLRLDRFGRAGAFFDDTKTGGSSGLEQVVRVAPVAEAARVEYRRPGLTEWYVNRPNGIEQGFTIEQVPAGGKHERSGSATGRVAEPTGPVVLEMTLDGTARARASKDGASIEVLSPRGDEVLRYAALHVSDAAGQPVEGSLRLETAPADLGGITARPARLRIEIRDQGATYPLVVDPLLTTPSWIVESNQANAHLGIAVASAGDVNGDGFADVAVSAPWFDANAMADEGRVFVYHGSATGLSTTPAWFVDGNQAGSFFGYSTASAGDVNKDGYGDLIVGDDSYTNTLSGEGKAVVYLGSATGLATTPAWTQYGKQAQAGFGYSVASAGDVNKDGYGDVIVAADLYDAGTTVGSDEGRVFLYLGSATGLAGSPAWIANGPQVSDEFGWQIASAGDVNKDGYGDIIIGSTLFDISTLVVDAGKVYVYYGTPTGLATAPAWTAVNNRATSFFGYSVASAGDVNNDGYGDVIIGAHYFQNTLTEEGRAYLYLGSATGLGATPAWTANGGQTGAHFGNSVASAGDVDADGFGDVLVGALDYSLTGAASEGRAYLFRGTATGLATTPAWTTDSGQAGAWYGWQVASAGDVNRDGFSDVVIGAPVYANGQSGEGRAYLYAGSGTCVDRDGDGYGNPGGTGCRLGTVLDCNDANAAINPGAAEVCDGIDNNCDGRIDNAHVPGGIPALTVVPSSGNTSLSWPAMTGATAYDIVMGDAGVLQSTGGDFIQATQRCLGDNWTTTSYLDTHVANVDQCLFFLVRPVNCGGGGTYDEGGGGQVAPRDAEIKASVGACP